MNIEQNITAIAAGAAMAKKTSTVLGASLLYNMVIFNDPAYIVIACLGAFVSMASVFYDVQTSKETKKAKGEECTAKLGLEMFKAFWVGAIFTVLSFMIFHQAGGEALKSLFQVDWFHKMLPSFWLLLTLALATESVYFFTKMMNIFKGKAKIEASIKIESKVGNK